MSILDELREVYDIDSLAFCQRYIVELEKVLAERSAEIVNKNDFLALQNEKIEYLVNDRDPLAKEYTEAKVLVAHLEEENKKIRDIILSGNAWNEEVAKMRKKLQRVR